MSLIGANGPMKKYKRLSHKEDKAMKLSARYANELSAWNDEVKAIRNGKRCSGYHKTVANASVAFYSELYKAAAQRGM